MKRRSSIAWMACAAAAAAISLAPAAPSQAQQVDASWAQAPYAQHELDQMLAPIALYPDALLAQVLMAATYPLEVVEADRFLRNNPGLSGDALADAVERMPWDPSVQALTQFPAVLAMMSERPDWTEQLGDAFLAQREQVMDTVQALRERAWAAGNLQSNDQQQVIVQDRVIVIEPWQPGLLWVPYYNPLIVFGTWWWPAYQPFLWVPPVAYRPPRFAEVYTVGFVWGPFVPLRPRLWHDPRPVWRDRYVVVDNTRVSNVIVTRPGTPRPVIWRHDPQHRRGVEYRTPPRDRFVSPPPGADPRHRALPEQRRDRPPQQPDRRWNDGAPDRRWNDATPGPRPNGAMPDRPWNGRTPDRRGERPPSDRVMPQPDDRAAPWRNAPGGPDAQRGARGDANGQRERFTQRRNGDGQPRNDFERRPGGNAGPRDDAGTRREDFRGQRGNPPPARAPESTPLRVQKPMPAPGRSEIPRPQVAQPPRPQPAPPQSPRMTAPPPARIAPPPQMAPPRAQPSPAFRAQPGPPPQARPQSQPQPQPRGRNGGPERQREHRDR